MNLSDREILPSTFVERQNDKLKVQLHKEINGMTIFLSQGQQVSLDSFSPHLSVIFVGLGWDITPHDTGYDFDLDAAAFLLGDDNKLLSKEHLVFFNNPISPDPNQSVQHLGDNLTGSGDGDDEVILIKLNQVPDAVKKILITVNIYEGDKRRQNFGQIQNAFVRLVNMTTKEEVIHYNLVKHEADATSLIVSALIRHNHDWDIRAIGWGFEGSFMDLFDRYS